MKSIALFPLVAVLLVLCLVSCEPSARIDATETRDRRETAELETIESPDRATNVNTIHFADGTTQTFSRVAGIAMTRERLSLSPEWTVRSGNRDQSLPLDQIQSIKVALPVDAAGGCVGIDIETKTGLRFLFADQSALGKLLEICSINVSGVLNEISGAMEFASYGVYESVGGGSPILTFDSIVFRN